jgi:hypothetical protein
MFAIWEAEAQPARERVEDVPEEDGTTTTRDRTVPTFPTCQALFMRPTTPTARYTVAPGTTPTNGTPRDAGDKQEDTSERGDNDRRSFITALTFSHC